MSVNMKEPPMSLQIKYRFVALFPLVLFFLFQWGMTQAQSVSEPLILAHSHNDYEQKRPLDAALEHGFNSIEIDIIRHGEILVVSHDEQHLGQKPDIETLYFRPLKEYLENQELQVWLLIDVKKYDEKTLDLLHTLVARYDSLFQQRSGVVKPLQILLSGDLPRKEILENESYVYFFIDGRVEDLGKGFDSRLMPLISTNFTHHSEWGGRAKPGKEDLQAIRQLVNSVHAEKKKIRFWKTRDSKRVWRALNDTGVDVIGVDHIKRFRRIFKQ